MTENVRKEFSLDYYQTLMETYWYSTAIAYKDLFVLQRKINRLQKKFGIEEWATFDKEVYNDRLTKRWIVYASEYKEYFLAKNQLIRNMQKIRFQTDEPIDEKVEKFSEEIWDDDLDEMPDTEKRAAKLERARAAYEEKFWKKVANGYKNNLERIEKKLAE